MRCHTAIGAEWRASLHRKAWDDEVFLAAYTLEPTPFCRRCHAPEIDEQRSDPDPSRHLGISCVTCHVLDTQILGARQVPASSEGHPTFAEPRMRGADWCSGCHEFEFPERQEALMQSTLSEHRASQHVDRSCQDCHMPRVTHEAGGSHKSHTFRVQGNAAMLRSAISGQARRSGPRSITVSLRVTGAGHAVPTGDLFRRLEVRASAGGMHASPVVLARAFRRQPGAHGDRRVQIGDTRLPASGEAKQIELVFPQPVASAAIAWEVVYQRMGPHLASFFDVSLQHEEVSMASGVLTAEPHLEEVAQP